MPLHADGLCIASDSIFIIIIYKIANNIVLIKWIEYFLKQHLFRQIEPNSDDVL